jgi:hypothetical protein
LAATGSRDCSGRRSPEGQWPDDKVWRDGIPAQWEEPSGDMCQEFVSIGQGLDEAETRRDPDTCLLDDEEVVLGLEGGQKMSDPFPPWTVDQ